ncbi:hypothetical protein V6W59_00320 [Mannheimia sp. HC-2023]|uniref:hypothetical protein n=1 Tax=Mannheimia indoligenes TaxID=3103145 RepID=UPI002FE5FF5D
MKNYLVDFFYSILIACGIIAIGVKIEPSFFFVDDAQNEFLPFMREIGRIWLNGEIPFILENTFFGSNTLIDIHRAIFLPQNILLAILSVKIHSLTLVANISAAINLIIMSFSAMKIAEALRLNKSQGLIIALLFCISPIFLYFYLESWWNGAIGQAWFVAALASILHLRNNFSIFNVVMNIISVYCILASGWPHSAIAYAIIAIIFCLELLWDKKYKTLLYFIVLSISIIAIVFPLYSEYLSSSDLITRASSTNNNGNFLSTTLNQIVFTFNPVYYHFMHRFQGYMITHIPMGYSSIYILFALCFSNLSTIFRDRNVIIISLMTLLFFILNQTPTHMGPLRWSFRFTPYFAELLILFSLLVLSKGFTISKKRVLLFIGIVLLSSILSLFAQESNFMFIFIVQIAFIFSTLFYLKVVLTQKNIKLLPASIYTIFCFSLMLAVKPNILGYVAMPWLKDELNLENNYAKGYLLSLTNGRQPKDHVEDLNGAQFLLFGLKAINGASPVGNKLISNVLDTHSSQAYFNPEKTVDNLAERFNDVCKFSLFNIDTLVINKDQMNENIRSNLLSCGFENKPVLNQNVEYYINNSFYPRASVSYISQGISNIDILEDGYNIEKYRISTDRESFIILSRVFWNGYVATLDGINLDIVPQDGVVKIFLPPNINDGILKISYFPSSWKYTLWISMLGFLTILGLMLFLKRRDS